jgi:hypothetical protein
MLTPFDDERRLVSDLDDEVTQKGHVIMAKDKPLTDRSTVGAWLKHPVGGPLIRQMLADWASATSREEIAGVLVGVEKHAWEKFGASFVELPPERRHEVVRGFDEDRVGRQDPPYGKFKYLVLAGYYLSEVGATQELRYELIPGAWRPCVPFSEIGRATAVG